jgi:hypothetical protein
MWREALSSKRGQMVGLPYDLSFFADYGILCHQHSSTTCSRSITFLLRPKALWLQEPTAFRHPTWGTYHDPHGPHGSRLPRLSSALSSQTQMSTSGTLYIYQSWVN